jgi:acyl-coenzyme A synthetase/AMP-(fatty) acid ligase/acyl carrier protein
MYTSGSTGSPKGVCCTHVGAMNLLADMGRRKLLGMGDKCSLWTSMSFDVSVYEIFSTLATGATLHIVPESLRADAPGFVRWLHAAGITSGYIPPFAVRELADWVNHNGAMTLRRMLVGVEPIPEPVLADIAGSSPQLRIINGYGPTEAAICATLCDIDAQMRRERNAPIGLPVANTKLYVVDAEMRRVHAGVPGELLIGGIGLARGYLHRPDLTAERFVPDPFSDEAGSRVYRTGDVVRRLPDGTLEFIGRLDFQAKIRGFRVELGEVEATLNRHPEVREAVVGVRQDVSGENRLIAYVSLYRQGVTVSALRRHLQQTLPDHMVPSLYAILDRIPRTRNDKVDREALARLPSVRPELDASYVPPASDVEALVASIWQDVLVLDRIGVEDHFLELGGTSLLAKSMKVRLEQRLGRELSISALFEHSTVRALAQYLEGLEPDSEPLRERVRQRVRRRVGGGDSPRT